MTSAVRRWWYPVPAMWLFMRPRRHNSSVQKWWQYPIPPAGYMIKRGLMWRCSKRWKRWSGHVWQSMRRQDPVRNIMKAEAYGVWSVILLFPALHRMSCIWKMPKRLWQMAVLLWQKVPICPRPWMRQNICRKKVCSLHPARQQMQAVWLLPHWKWARTASVWAGPLRR